MILLPRFKSRPACSARPIALQIESSHRCINQHRPSCHQFSVRRFLSPELPTTLRPRRLWQATGPDVKAIRTCSRCSYLSFISQTEVSVCLVSSGQAASSLYIASVRHLGFSEKWNMKLILSPGRCFSLCAKFCANMCSSDRVMAVKVNFKMAAPAILDFAGIKFWRQNGLWGMVFSPCIKFRANICHSGRDIGLNQFSKWRPPPS